MQQLLSLAYINCRGFSAQDYVAISVSQCVEFSGHIEKP